MLNIQSINLRQRFDISLRRKLLKMRIIYRLTLLAGLLTSASGYLTAQVSIDKLPALINDSIVGISIPQMDYLVQVKHSRESTYDMLMVYKRYYEEANDQSQKRLQQVLTQNALISDYEKQSLSLRSSLSHQISYSNQLESDLKKSRRNGVIGWISAGILVGAGSILYITK